MKDEPVKVLIVESLLGRPFVLRTDSRWCAWDVENIGSDLCEDLGIDYCPTPSGFCLFEGLIKVDTNHVGDGQYEPETVYEGKARPVEIDELSTLLAMVPPDDPNEQEERE